MNQLSRGERNAWERQIRERVNARRNYLRRLYGHCFRDKAEREVVEDFHVAAEYFELKRVTEEYYRLCQLKDKLENAINKKVQPQLDHECHDLPLPFIDYQINHRQLRMMKGDEFAGEYARLHFSETDLSIRARMATTEQEFEAIWIDVVAATTSDFHPYAEGDEEEYCF